MLQKLGALLASALEQAAAADQQARDATHPQDRLLNEDLADKWRALARSYEIVGSVKQFLIRFPKKGDLPRFRTKSPADPTMPPLLFRCPITGAGVNGFLIEESPSDDHNSFDAVTCLDCGQTHLVNLRTGATVGEVRQD